MKAVELFAGAGGLALGVGFAGFKHAAVIEWDTWACETLRENQERGHPLVMGWPVSEADVRGFEYASVDGPVDLVAGGPPCQPFSLGGKHRAHLDDRDMFPATVKAIRLLKPRAFIVENVKGLTRATFNNYFEYIHLQLKFPQMVKRKGESVNDHYSRLERQETGGPLPNLGYNVIPRLLNAADFGIPQRRERVFFVGIRNDLGVEWNFPDETHSKDALLFKQYVTGEYWDKHRVAKRLRPLPTKTAQRRVEMLRSEYDEKDGPKPWRTVRDALVGLPDPEKRSRNAGMFLNHNFQPGAKIYPGHTGSPLDLPAKTLKAGVHGVPGGENMMVKPSGEVRYFTVRESARLQMFPDNYAFHGSWTETMRQLGNAVPVALARIVAASILEKLVEADARKIAAQRQEIVLQ